MLPFPPQNIHQSIFQVPEEIDLEGYEWWCKNPDLMLSTNISNLADEKILKHDLIGGKEYFGNNLRGIQYSWLCNHEGVKVDFSSFDVSGDLRNILKIDKHKYHLYTIQKTDGYGLITPDFEGKIFECILLGRTYFPERISVMYQERCNDVQVFQIWSRFFQMELIHLLLLFRR